MQELVRFLWKPHSLMAFNLFGGHWPGDWVAVVRQAVLLWLQLCVLQDKLIRLVDLTADAEVGSLRKHVHVGTLAVAAAVAVAVRCGCS